MNKFFMNDSGTGPRLRWVLLFLFLMGLVGNNDFEDKCHSVGGVVLQNGDCSK